MQNVNYCCDGDSDVDGQRVMLMIVVRVRGMMMMMIVLVAGFMLLQATESVFYLTCVCVSQEIIYYERLHIRKTIVFDVQQNNTQGSSDGSFNSH